MRVLREEEEKKRRRGDQARRSSWIFVGGDPYQGMWVLCVGWSYPPHTKLIFMIWERIGFVVEVVWIVEVVSCCCCWNYCWLWDMIGVVFLSCILLNVEGLYVLSDWGTEPLKLESLELVTWRRKSGSLQGACPRRGLVPSVNKNLLRVADRTRTPLFSELMFEDFLRFGCPKSFANHS